MLPVMDTNGNSNAGIESERQVQVKFVTKLPPSLRVVSSAFAIPAKLGRYGLSEVVNTLLGLGTHVNPYGLETHNSGNLIMSLQSGTRWYCLLSFLQANFSVLFPSIGK